jgi:hypothetical protein
MVRAVPRYRIKSLRFEALEQRALLSVNNVLVSLNATTHDMTITGNDASNSIVIEQSGSTYTVRGLSTADGQTLINGHSTAQSFTSSSGTVRNLTINMKKGTDSVQIVGVETGETVISRLMISKDLTVDMGGSGNKFLDIDAVRIGRNASLATGKGQDVVDMGETIIDGWLDMNTGSGNGMVGFINTQVSGNANIDPQSSNDFIGMVNFSVGGRLSVDAGGGNNIILATLDSDTISGQAASFGAANSFFAPAKNPNTDDLVNDLTAATRDATNSFTAAYAEFKTGLACSSGKACNFIDIGEAAMRGDLKIETGNSLDIIGVSDSTVGGNASIKTGSQDDLVALLALDVAGRLCVDTGCGCDVVTVSKQLFDTAFDDFAAKHPCVNLHDLREEFRATNHRLTLIDNFYSPLTTPQATFDTGDGNDHVYFSDVRDSSMILTICLGCGNDQLRFEKNIISSIFLNAGQGKDTVAATSNKIPQIRMLLAAGDDQLSFVSNTFTTAFLGGGTGKNTLTASGNSGSLTSVNFL